jgi:hypothetical protein
MNINSNTNNTNNTNTNNSNRTDLHGHSIISHENFEWCDDRGEHCYHRVKRGRNAHEFQKENPKQDPCPRCGLFRGYIEFSAVKARYLKYKYEQQHEKPLPQWILDARQATDKSNYIQSLMGHLLEELTGMDSTERLRISDNLEKGQIYRREIARKSREHYLTLAKQIPDGHIHTIIGVLQSLHFLMDEFEKTLSEEVILRKSRSEMSGV